MSVKGSGSIYCCKCKIAERRPGQKYCPACQSAYLREWRKRNPGYDVKRVQHLGISEQQKILHRASVYAQNGRKRGYINPEMKCTKCGSENDLQMHHEDYSKKLDVIVLCRPCHTALHTERRREKKWQLSSNV